ncbi:MAG TPA: VOC family protein [Solirubrobacteraceae bacterium]|nr:VOC family protein [Solirubrobacteraceae bacterium]
MADERPVLHHVNLKTTRMQAMIDWYGRVVGMEPSWIAPDACWLTNDAANHRLAMLAVAGLSDDAEKLAHTGLHHLAFEYASYDALLAACASLLEDGIRPHMVLDHGMTMSFYFVDPDGNSVELQADNFGDWSRSKEWMRTAPEFAANPIGVPVDPEAIIAAWRDGDGADELHRRAYAGEFAPSGELDMRLP